MAKGGVTKRMLARHSQLAIKPFANWLIIFALRKKLEERKDQKVTEKK
jgi:hypothetical protein